MRITQRQLLVATIVVAAALCGLFLPSGGEARRGGGAALVQDVGAQVDVVIAVDTTGSMRTVLAAAQADLAAILARVQGLLPNAQFGVVAFSDLYHRQPEYAVVRALTTDAQSVQADLAGLTARGSPDPRDTPAEALNVVLRQSYADPALGWRATARKFLLLVTNAQPYGARNAGLAACSDTSPDPHGQNTATELTAMRESKRSLVVLLPGTGRLKPICAAEMVERSYPGGGVLRLGDGSAAAGFADVLQAALVAITVSADLPLTRAKGTIGATVRLANPTEFPFASATVRLVLPPGLSYEKRSASGSMGQPRQAPGELSFVLGSPPGPGVSVVSHLVLRAERAGRPSLRAVAEIGFGDAAIISREASTEVLVVKAPARVDASVVGRSAKGVRLSGIVHLRSPTPDGASEAWGSFVVRPTARGLVRVRVVGARLTSFAAPSRISVDVKVREVERASGCSVGTSGTLELVDSGGLLSNGRTLDRAQLTLPPGCAAADVWSNVGQGSVELSLQAS